MNVSLWRGRVKSLLKRYGVLPPAVTLRHFVRLLPSPRALRQELSCCWEFWQVKRRYGLALRPAPNCQLDGKALIFGMGMPSFIKVELALLKSVQLAGYRSVVLLRWRHPLLEYYYRLVGADEVLYLDEALNDIEQDEASAIIHRVKLTHQLLEFEYLSTRVGRSAVSTTLRRMRTGHLNLGSAETRQLVAESLSAAMRSAKAAHALVKKIKPKLAIFLERGYTPWGEWFDQCLKADVDVIMYNAAHKNNCLIFKRYRMNNRDIHPVSLSPESWAHLRRMQWTDAHRRRLQDEIYTNYATGEWYGEVGTQIHKRIISRYELCRRLGLDPSKKTAVIFSHIFWDATCFWGTDLFDNYEEWFVEAVRAACANTSINWIVKVHPANVTKNRREGVTGEPAEMTAIRKHVGELPSHITLITADSNINTYSLFDLMDYCLTVRGTIGIEAASFGIPVLTAGTGRYDHQGFTVDSETREEYLANLARIADLPPLSPVQREMAERFAYGVFLLRPLPLQSVTLEYQQDSTATIHSEFRIETPEQLAHAPDLKALAAWIKSGDEDFLVPDDVGNTALVGG